MVETVTVGTSNLAEHEVNYSWPFDLTVSYRTFPAELLPLATALMQEWHWLVPRWLRTLAIVCACDDEQQTSAEAECDVEYRQATIVLHHSFWRNSNSERSYHFVHELVHLHNLQCADLASDVVKHVLQGDEQADYRNFVLGEMRKNVERATQDLAMAITDNVVRFGVEGEVSNVSKPNLLGGE